jgi:hypothetical protein
MFVEFPSLGHGPSTSHPCPQGIVRAFYAAPAAALDTACVDEIGPPVFVTPGTPVPLVRLEPFTDELSGIAWSGVVPEGWEQQTAGVWARSLNGFDQTSLVQQVAAGTTPARLLASARTQFGLGDDPQPVGEYASAMGTWSLYDGALAGVPASVALLDIPEGTAFVLLVSSPSERDHLRDEVFFAALDAFSVG